ncbi:MAG: TonB-dependent receptor, partial [Flavipsychrobacter sp.]|nr:TonB-dependent receptor [Flavipsychrobacter sp.]
MFIGASDTLFNRYVSNQAGSAFTTQIQQNFIGDMKVLGLRNRVVAGVDFLQVQTHNNNSPYVMGQVNSVRLDDPRYGMFARQIIDTAIAASKTPRTNTATNGITYGAYISDVVNLTPTTLAMLSVRFDEFDNKGTTNFNTDVTTGAYEQTTISPKFGLVQQIMKDKLAVFANYMNGFRNVAPVVQPLAELDGTFELQQANQVEGGVKLDALNHKLSVTASYYDILVTN